MWCALANHIYVSMFYLLRHPLLYKTCTGKMKQTKSSYDVTMTFRNLYRRFRHMAKVQGAKMRLHRMRLHRRRLQGIGQQRLHRLWIRPRQDHLVPQHPLYSLLLYCIAVPHAQIYFMIFYESYQSVKSEIIKTVFYSK